MFDKVGLYNWKHFSHSTSFHFTCERYFHLEIMASSSNHGSSFVRNSCNSSSSIDDEISEQLFVDMDRQRGCVFSCAIVVNDSFHMFNPNELGKHVG
jgi:hypothetical protein